MSRALKAALSAVALVLASGVSSMTSANAAGPCTNVILGTDQNDLLNGTVQSDQILGLRGNDELFGGPGGDCISGDSGADRLIGGADADKLVGERSADELLGGEGDDRLEGQSGNDFLFGGAGRDVLIGGSGEDRIEEVGDGYGPDETIDAGTNTVRSGSGRDSINVANGRKDRVDCGADRDRVSADRADALVGCERRIFLVAPFPAVEPSVSANRKRPFLISFRALATTSRRTEFFSIAVRGPGGCRSIVSNSIGETYHVNRVVPYKLLPFSGDGSKAERWCPGLYRGSVSFVEIVEAGCQITATASPNPGCTDQRSIGEFSFRVR